MSSRTRYVIGSAVFLLVVGLLVVFLFREGQTMTQDQTVTQNETAVSSSDSMVNFIKKVEVTPDETYTYGAFCRVNYVEETDDFFVSFGGSTSLVPFDPEKIANRAGGAEGGNGYSYKQYTSSFEYTGENGVLSNTGGDAASVMAEGYYFILTGGPGGWLINKIDPSTWTVVKSASIALDKDTDAGNDQMLAYANGFLIASSVWSDVGEARNQGEADPTKGSGTHNHILTTDLEEIDSFILNDTSHINGSYVVYVDGVYHYITSTAFFGTLIIMQYDEEWNYLGTITTEEYGQWAQGAVYDSASEKFYVAYIDLGTVRNGKLDPRIKPNIAIGVFDKNWSLLESVPVTDYTRDDTAATGRPSVILQDSILYVSYDVETSDPVTHEENKDWQCYVKMYEIEM
ncbi:hypothetical protein HY733_02365 [Candidatus Uhrbacteria bacterium]|nr:hypothetical protein [Candidatus Uhrbacteria bacterium]